MDDLGRLSKTLNTLEEAFEVVLGPGLWTREEFAPTLAASRWIVVHQFCWLTVFRGRLRLHKCKSLDHTSPTLPHAHCAGVCLSCLLSFLPCLSHSRLTLVIIISTITITITIIATVTTVVVVVVIVVAWSLLSLPRHHQHIHHHCLSSSLLRSPGDACVGPLHGRHHLGGWLRLGHRRHLPVRVSYSIDK